MNDEEDGNVVFESAKGMVSIKCIVMYMNPSSSLESFTVPMFLEAHTTRKFFYVSVPC